MNSKHGDVIIQSHSGDTDINVLALSILINDCERVLIDNKTGKNRKVIWLSDVELSSSEKDPFRASCIFRKRLRFLFLFKNRVLVGRLYAIILDILTPLLT